MPNCPCPSTLEQERKTKTKNEMQIRISSKNPTKHQLDTADQEQKKETFRPYTSNKNQLNKPKIQDPNFRYFRHMRRPHEINPMCTPKTIKVRWRREVNSFFR